MHSRLILWALEKQRETFSHRHTPHTYTDRQINRRIRHVFARLLHGISLYLSPCLRCIRCRSSNSHSIQMLCSNAVLPVRQFSLCHAISSLITRCSCRRRRRRCCFWCFSRLFFIQTNYFLWRNFVDDIFPTTVFNHRCGDTCRSIVYVVCSVCFCSLWFCDVYLMSKGIIHVYSI